MVLSILRWPLSRLLLTIALLADNCHCLRNMTQTERETALVERLLDGYNVNALPVPEGGLQVEISIALGQFVAISTALETVEFQGWWRMWWNDPRLTWDPEVEGLSAVSLNPNLVWLPDVTVYEQIQDAVSPSKVTVSPDGTCFTSVPRRTKIGCPMLIGSFPYDRQRCNFTVGSWSYDGTRIDIAPRKQDVSDLLQDGELPDRLPFDLEPYKGFQEFWLAAVKTIWRNRYYNCCPEPWPNLIVEFDLHRSTQTYLSGMVVPLILVTCVGFFSLFMPAPPSGARPALSVTVMLTTATVYFVASRSTPQSNQSTSIGRIYIYSLASSFFLVFLSIITTALNLVQPEDKSESKKMIDFFQRHDTDGDGSLDRDQFDAALASLGLSPAERSKVMKFFITESDPTINKEQWVAFSSITEKKDDPAVYHNGVVRALVHKAMELEIKQSGKSLGKSTQDAPHPAAPASAPEHQPAPKPLPLPLSLPAADNPASSSVATAPVERSLPTPLTTVPGPAPQLAYANMPDSSRMWLDPGLAAQYSVAAGQWTQGVRFGHDPRLQVVHGSCFGNAIANGNGEAGVEEGKAGGREGAHVMAGPSFGRLGSWETPLPSGNPSFKAVAKRIARVLNTEVRQIPGPQRMGRELASTIDKWARILMPLGFFIFLTLEFTGVIAGGDSVGANTPYRDSAGNAKTRVEYFDYRTSVDGRCFRNFPKTRQAENLFDIAEETCS